MDVVFFCLSNFSKDSAEIITEDLPLAARFFNPIKSLFLN